MLSISIQTVHNPDYEDIGGETRIRLLVERFYHHMDALPEVRGVRAMHPADLSGSCEKLYEFMSGWLGGPPLYAQKHGQPRLRTGHRPFAIGDNERDQWLLCMRRALDEVVEDSGLRERLYANLAKIAHHISNKV